jgi:hypothetical protein
MGDMRYFGQGAPKNLSAALALYAANAGDAQVLCLLSSYKRRCFACFPRANAGALLAFLVQTQVRYLLY